ncbi:MAG: YdeI/OmpD-associated family protein [Ignavibacteriae bacterium]|nr:YdeI/OmpD-associated family protein [Ignavibacteriota bacterium]
MNLTHRAKPIFFKSQSELRQWYKKNYDKLTEMWVGFYNVASGKQSVTYKQALDEALCFGWIDGVRKRTDDESYIMRFTPRKKKSYWSDVNTKRAKELIKLGKMHSSGLKVFNARDQQKTKRYSFERKTATIDGELGIKFKANKKAWEFFEVQAPYYKRVFSHWVTSAKQEETQHRRLDVLIKASAAGRRLDMLDPFEKRK